jgi:hypothetical protein
MMSSMSPRRVVPPEPQPDDLDDLDMTEDQFDAAFGSGHTCGRFGLGGAPTLTVASGSSTASVGGGESISIVTRTTTENRPVAA